MLHNDTIVAISSAPGASARGIVRLSGPAAWNLALGIAQIIPPTPDPESLAAHRAYSIRLRATVAGGIPGLLLLFRGPRSYTGLDVAELHLPGSPALLRM
ncbi:MAG: tRNA uridine-5-carboxymethylaminomethyl(34) synthesis GTPase MnmE, partial [Phycisphaerae bacterium]